MGHFAINLQFSLSTEPKDGRGVFRADIAMLTPIEVLLCQVSLHFFSDLIRVKPVRSQGCGHTQAVEEGGKGFDGAINAFRIFLHFLIQNAIAILQ